jgi:hypothetical protein
MLGRGLMTANPRRKGLQKTVFGPWAGRETRPTTSPKVTHGHLVCLTSLLVGRFAFLFEQLDVHLQALVSNEGKLSLGSVAILQLCCQDRFKLARDFYTPNSEDLGPNEMRLSSAAAVKSPDHSSDQ